MSKTQFEISKEYTTDFTAIGLIGLCSDGSMWIGNQTNSKLQHVKLMENRTEVITSLNDQIFGMAKTHSNNFLVTTVSTKIKLINTVKGQITDSKYDVKPSYPICIHETRDHHVIIGAKSSQERTILPHKDVSYYKAQDELIGAFEDIQLGVDEDMDDSEEARQLMKTAGFCDEFSICPVDQESIEKIINLTTGDSKPPTVDIATIVITASAIVIKFVLWLVCRRIKTPTVQALALDHRNDVLSNAVALVCGYVGSQELLDKTGEKGLIYVDPIGAIVISIYIIINWWITGYGQIKMLTGHTAKPDFLKKLTWICVNHHPKVQYVDTVRAFHFGNNFLVEVDIVLPEDMTLKEAHDIGEPLQQKLERLKEVERAFVHLDYEFEHNPLTEHKMA
ncbi:Metal tolerance protein 9,Metal tolerance protein 10,Metal tolerance protein 11,Metal tolerance protein 5,Metal tolerance protein 7,Metal tolerance protein 4,Metal tolerance protein 3,Metal tolerance protein 6,Putative metal tolerance protein C3 [Mytilus edulis]|uniref:Cation efflux protein cytoplasmic domain-containing protein n=1 Tax=Mytilus edulis TaxID=6550 RepID=A0A8S3QX51_MYTED|nr:Metal tolerance protein 9,Metal tolerance protein 10,Metal tolerance protein 11,Metal tolerance protein 5,Metal tolerance protein 7,Metal tolerance protein 4,Metal tolerance protein 3,Metal tolerance protein 6,Putative metal tolerance protein C3 [Mytilus edulis]